MPGVFDFLPGVSVHGSLCCVCKPVQLCLLDQKASQKFAAWLALVAYATQAWQVNVPATKLWIKGFKSGVSRLGGKAG